MKLLHFYNAHSSLAVWWTVAMCIWQVFMIDKDNLDVAGREKKKESGKLLKLSLRQTEIQVFEK